MLYGARMMVCDIIIRMVSNWQQHEDLSFLATVFFGLLSVHFGLLSVHFGLNSSQTVVMLCKLMINASVAVSGDGGIEAGQRDPE